MKWTNKRPRANGWYWMRKYSQVNQDGGIYYEENIVQVWLGKSLGKRGYVHSWPNSCDWADLVKEESIKTTLWAGPLDIPENVDPGWMDECRTYLPIERIMATRIDYCIAAA